jgi:hypothetical protein
MAGLNLRPPRISSRTTLRTPVALPDPGTKALATAIESHTERRYTVIMITSQIGAAWSRRKTTRSFKHGRKKNQTMLNE